MQLQKFRWSRVYESSEEELIALLSAKNIKVQRWHVDAMQDLEANAYTLDTTIWCAEGSIVFDFGQQKYSIQPGDGLAIPANFGFTATAGITGCAIYQAI